MTAKNMLHKDGAALFTTNRDAYNKLRAIGQSKTTSSNAKCQSNDTLL